MMNSPPNIQVSDHPLVATKLSILRAKTTAPDEFRRNLQELSAVLFAQAARSWSTAPIEIEKPLTASPGVVLQHPIAAVPILRAGLGMLEGVLRVAPEV